MLRQPKLDRDLKVPCTRYAFMIMFYVTGYIL